MYQLFHVYFLVRKARAKVYSPRLELSLNSGLNLKTIKNVSEPVFIYIYIYLSKNKGCILSLTCSKQIGFFTRNRLWHPNTLKH